MEQTSCMNSFQPPLHAVLIIDANDKSQLLSSGFFNNRAKSEISRFFSHLKSRPGMEFITFVVNKHKTNCDPMKESFPSSVVIFCRKHIAHSIKHVFGCRKLLSVHLDVTYGRKINAKLTIVVRKLLETGNESQKRLITSRPSCSGLGMLDCINGKTWMWTTKRVDGFFRKCKNPLDQTLHPLCEIADDIHFHPGNAMGTSISLRRLESSTFVSGRRSKTTRK
jgi:hypothetical protein